MENRVKAITDGTYRRLPAVRWSVVLLLALASACSPAQGERTDSAGAEGVPAAAGSENGTPAAAAQEARPPRGTAWVIFGADTVLAEVARDPDDRAEGLMYREELAEDTGMLFVFDNNQIRSFWMSNTYLALDIAYMDPSFTIVDIQQMEPLTTTPHESAAPAMFALEVTQGWFAAHGIAVGATAQVVFGLP